MFADKPWLYFQNLFQEENELSEKNITVFSIFLFVNERVIEKYGRVRCIHIFADYGFCVFQEQTLSFIEKHPVLMEGDVFTELPQHLKKEVQQAITNRWILLYLMSLTDSLIETHKIIEMSLYVTS
jgi:hypothetical protein